MAENSAIEWCDHTFNPWIGCTKVSPGCDYCYAEQLATKRLGVGWGPHAERRHTSASTWAMPRSWDRRARREGRRHRVFCASLADWCDNQVPDYWRAELLETIRLTDALDWLLLTKRPQLIRGHLRAAAEAARGRFELLAPWLERWLAGDAPRNVWLGTTVENQEEAGRRIGHLLGVPARVHFLSCEPLLGPVDLTMLPWPLGLYSAFDPWSELALRGRVGWVICGGESGPGARPMHPDWARSLRDQCAAAGVPFFFKQWGDWLPGEFGCAPLVEWQDGTNSDQHLLPGDDRPRFDDGLGFVAEGMAHAIFCRVGKKAAGATLDGREHRAFPEPGDA